MAKNETLLSVVIPVYNPGPYLAACLDSILTQKDAAFELVLVDDGSTDGSPAVLRDYAARFSCIRLITTENRGVASARRTGLAAAEGRYILYMDSDDMLAPGALEKLAEICGQEAPDVLYYGIKQLKDGVCSSYGDNCRPGRYGRKELEEELFPRLIHGADASYVRPNLCGLVLKKEALSAHMIDHRDAMMAEDFAVTVPCLFEADSLIVLEDELYIYRRNGESVTMARKPFNWNCPEVVARHIEAHIDLSRGDFRAQLDRKLTHDLFNTAAAQFYAAGGFLKNRRRILQELKRPYYREAIRRSRFAGSPRAVLMSLAMKLRLCGLIRLFSVWRIR